MLMSRTRAKSQNFYPGYFAFVMATGIISISTKYVGLDTYSTMFLIFACAGYVALVCIYAQRALDHAAATWADMTHPAKSFGYLTFVAATNVIASRFSMLHWYTLSIVLGLVALIAWLFLMYFIVYQLVFHNEMPIQNVVNGSWLLTAVSTESVAAWASSIVFHVSRDAFPLLFLAYTCWSLGIFIYLIFITLIMTRFFFHHTGSQDIDAPYWINMGAMAIATLAGGQLILHPDHLVFLTAIKPMIEGLTITLWAWGTWWIPFLVLAGIKKHLLSRDPVTYHPALWGMVFPLGMYTAATDTLSHVHGLHPLYSIVSIAVWVAMAAWVLVALLFVGGMVGVWRRRA